MVWTEHIPRFLQRFINLGVAPGDTEQEKAHKRTAVLIASITAPVVAVWTVVYGILGVPLAALPPFIYIVATIVGLVYLSRTKSIRLFGLSQVSMYVILPFLLQWALGGFANGSAVGMWALGAPLLAPLVGAFAWPWFIGFVGLSVFSGLIDSTLAASAPDVPQAVITAFFVLNFVGVGVITFIGLLFFIRDRERARTALEEERARSERLLLNILPSSIAQRLKQGEEPIADRLPEVTVLVADIVGFTPMSEEVPADEVVGALNELFSRFDDLTVELGLEKLKTVGDAYQAVGGLPGSSGDHVAAAAELALAMQEVVDGHAFPGFDDLQMRIGVNTGPVVAGVIGKRKFSYDIWGDTINTASRMESHGVPGRIQVTKAVHDKLSDRFIFERRGAVDIKGKGDMETYFLEARSSADQGTDRRVTGP